MSGAVKTKQWPTTSPVALAVERKGGTKDENCFPTRVVVSCPYSGRRDTPVGATGADRRPRRPPEL